MSQRDVRFLTFGRQGKDRKRGWFYQGMVRISSWRRWLSEAPGWPSNGNNRKYHLAFPECFLGARHCVKGILLTTSVTSPHPLLAPGRQVRYYYPGARRTQVLPYPISVPSLSHSALKWWECPSLLLSHCPWSQAFLVCHNRARVHPNLHSPGSSFVMAIMYEGLGVGYSWLLCLSRPEFSHLYNRNISSIPCSLPRELFYL